MKKVIFLSLLSACFFFAAAQDNTAVENTIKELEQKTIKAILDSDTVTLRKMWAPEFMVNTPRNEIAPNREAVLAIQRAGMINYSSFTRVIEKIQVQKDVVITMGYETLVPKGNLPNAGQPLKRRYLNVWMNQGGQWVQIARQASFICPER